MLRAVARTAARGAISTAATVNNILELIRTVGAATLVLAKPASKGIAIFRDFANVALAYATVTNVTSDT